MAERFLSSVQASQLLGINPDTMRRYLREGKVRALRLGKDWKIPESALSDLAKGGRLAKGGKPIASTPAPAKGNPLAQALAKVQARDKATPAPKLRTAGMSDAASELRQMREEQTP
jgi:excisionase family DNA binding protein